MDNGAVTAEVTRGIATSNYNYLWANNSINNSLTNINVGWYSLTVEDFNGCITKDSVKVEPQNRSCLVIPNAISPNGDLINDVWNIQNIHLYPEADVRIFNRWGNVVWVSEKGYPKPWDGTREGRDLPVDSYHYIIDLKNGDRPVIGTITIVK
jgi:gliding motility-associated-like protein